MVQEGGSECRLVDFLLSDRLGGNLRALLIIVELLCWNMACWDCVHMRLPVRLLASSCARMCSL